MNKLNNDLELILDDDNEVMSESESDSDSDNGINCKISTQITNYPINGLYYAYLKDDNKLLLTPEYQRDLCWSIDKMNAFIDTIIKGWIVPNYVIYELSSKEKKLCSHRYECIDGQHRLTTLKYYIENKMVPGTNRYIYWINNGYKVFYNMEKTTMENMRKKSKCRYRNLSDDERDMFDNFQMSIHMISSQNGISIGTKCDIFNRLQNGEKVSSYDKLKNHQHPITNIIRSNHLCKYLVENGFISKIFFDKNKSTKKVENLMIYFVIRSFFIIDKKSLDINYLDLNIKKGITYNDGLGEPKYRLKNDVSELLPKFMEFIDWITQNDKLDKPILIYAMYIYVCIYANHGLDELNKVIKWFNNPSNTNRYGKFNDLSSYKLGVDKVVKTEKVIDWYKTICKIILKIDLTEESTNTNSTTEIGITSKPKVVKNK